jgi:hypothetical protein
MDEERRLLREHRMHEISVIMAGLFRPPATDPSI